MEFLQNNYKLKEIALVNIQYLRKRETLIQKMCKFRNLFKNEFMSQKKTTISKTKIYLNKIIRNKKLQIMYGIIFKNRLLGVYSIKLINKKYYLLDSAIRFENYGPKNVFVKIGKFFIQKLKKYDKDKKIIIIINKKNIFAFNIHKYGKFLKSKKIKSELKIKSPFEVNTFSRFT